MQYEKWEEITNLVSSKFEVTDQGEVEGDHSSKIEYIEFKQGEEEMRLEFVCKPKLLEKKTIYSNRVGAQGTEKYVFDENEKVCAFKAYKYDDAVSDWKEIESSMFG